MNVSFRAPLYFQERFFAHEIASVEDVLDILQDWPKAQRGLAYEVMLKAAMEALCGRFPAESVRENFAKFLKLNGCLCQLENAVIATTASRPGDIARTEDNAR